MSAFNRIERIAPAAFAAVCVFLAGAWVGERLNRSAAPDMLTRVLARVRADYFRRVPAGMLEQGALRGILSTLQDPYSSYYDPESWRQFTGEFSGRSSYVGIGVALAPGGGGFRVTRVLPDSPASRARLRPGEVIRAVDGESIDGMTTELAVARIDGPAGSRVALTLAAGRLQRTITLARTRVPDPSVTVRTFDVQGRRIVDVRVARFAAGTSGLVIGALRRAAAAGVRGAILDLRGNEGGLVSEALATASAVLPRSATIVSLRTRSGPQRTYLATGDPRIPAGLPLVELVDHQTISAGEIFTGALKDNHRAVIVGQHTFGKGVFQELVPLPDGGGIELTTGEYFTPDGHNLGGGGTREGAGIIPDVEVNADPLAAALRLLATARNHDHGAD